jgi:GT2 family glycosyltransferase
MDRAHTLPGIGEPSSSDLIGELTANDSDDPIQPRSRLSCSVIVPAFEAAEYLPRCIEGLLAAGFAREEIICVDDGSSDGSRAVLERLGLAPLVLDGNFGAAHARNEGARQSTAVILFFVDADVVVHADTRERIERFFDEYLDYAAVFGCYDADPAGRSPVNLFRNLLHRHVHRQSAGDAVTFWSGCGAIRREAFERVGGFDPSQRMMEDVLVGLELHARGEKIRLDPDIEAKHLKRWTLGSMFWTDMVNRAIPWTRLLRTRLGKASVGRLNLNLAGRLSGISVGGTVLGLLIAVLSPATGLAITAASFLMLGLINRVFLGSMRRHFGMLNAMLALPLLWVHYLSACLGYAWARLRP